MNTSALRGMYMARAHTTHHACSIPCCCSAAARVGDDDAFLCDGDGDDHANEVPITFVAVDRVFGTSKLGGAEIVAYLRGLYATSLLNHRPFAFCVCAASALTPQHACRVILTSSPLLAAKARARAS